MTRILMSSSRNAALLLCLVLAACSKDNAGALYEGESGFAFASGVLNFEASPDDANVISVPIYRGSKEYQLAELEVQYDKNSGGDTPEWVDTDPEGIFTLTTKRVAFPDDYFTASAKISYTSLDALGINGRHRIRLGIKNDSSPSERTELIITVTRKLTFNKYGDCSVFDECVFEKAYKTVLYKAEEGEIYRIEDPYTEGLIAEEYAESGWMGETPSYVQFTCDESGAIHYEPFRTGMLVNGKFMAWAYYPGEYQWGRDFSSYNAKNRKISDKEFQLYPVYCLPDYFYGYLNEGAYPLTVKLL